MPSSSFHHELTYRLEARQVFEVLNQDNRRDAIYAHHLARACWFGSRIMLRQTSPEAEGIYDFILTLHQACDGKWDRLEAPSPEDIDEWLEFAGLFLSSLGNHFEDGDRKAIPRVSAEALRTMASISPEATSKLEDILEPMLSPQPAALGYPSTTSLSGYYLGDAPITKEEIRAVTDLMEARRIAPENTRLRRGHDPRTATDGDDPHYAVFEVLQASAETDTEPELLGEVTIEEARRAKVFLRRGDHKQEMRHICAELTEAIKHAATREQEAALSHLVESFRTGNYEAFRTAHKIWVKDKAPTVEHCMGFLFGYRDPYGARAEWQAAAGIAHREETDKMRELVAMATDLTRTLPWALADENDGKGPFEPTEPDVPDFAIIHVLASVSSTVWEATNMTIEDNGETIGIKNMVYGNRTSLNSKPGRPCHYVHPAKAKAYMDSAHIVRSIGTAIHELIGHGTGKLLFETSPGNFNFSRDPPILSPVTQEPIRTWYRPGQTYNSVFGDLATTMEECRAFLVASYLADNKGVLALFGYSEESSPTADDLIYYAYLQIGVEGLRALRSFNADDQVWAGDHDRAQFAILKHLLLDGGGVISIEEHENELFVHVDRNKIASQGKPSLGRMLCKIHVWHCTADIAACRPYYEALSAVDSEPYETWRRIVASKTEPKWKFVQPNTYLRADGTVELREYDASNEGIILSFFERGV